MKNSTVSSGKIRSKISSVGVGHPRNSRNNPIVKSIVSPASTPAQNPQISVLTQCLTDESEDGIGISARSLEVLLNEGTPFLNPVLLSELLLYPNPSLSF